MSDIVQKTMDFLHQFGASPAAQFLGFELLDIDIEAMTIRAKFTATDMMLNPRGTVQGGFLTAMLDEVMGILLLLKTRKGPASVDFHTQFFRPVPAGEIIGEAHVTYLGASTGFTEGVLFGVEGNKLAAAIQTQRLLTIAGAHDDGL